MKHHQEPVRNTTKQPRLYTPGSTIQLLSTIQTLHRIATPYPKSIHGRRATPVVRWWKASLTRSSRCRYRNRTRYSFEASYYLPLVGETTGVFAQEFLPRG